LIILNNLKRGVSMELHLKGWGYEKWIVNKEEYCGKLLFFKAGMKCSYHYHKVKDETFYLQSGRMVIRHCIDDSTDHNNFENECETNILEAGMSFYVPVSMRHQMEAITDCELYEFSTQHFEEDSYRIKKGD
tara:strand:- start:336 stop:731 length:396 start_codon:yes stop_codon:yes gene_type:complete